MPEELQSSYSQKIPSQQPEVSSIDSQEGHNDTTPDEQLPEHHQEESGTQLPAVTGVRRLVYLSLAVLFFTLGAAGAVLPGLPTTPFLLLTSFFLMRTSPKLNAMLLRSPIFGSILRDWQQRKAVRRDVKFQAIFIVASLGSFSIYFALPSFVIAGVLLVGVLIGIWVILRLPELPSGTSNDESETS